MFGRIGNMLTGFGFGGGSTPGNGLAQGFSPPSQAQLRSMFGPAPGVLDPTNDHILSQVFSPPYQGPLDLDAWSGETPAMRADFQIQYRTSPVLRAAVRGKADDICCLQPTMMPADKDDELSAQAAKFVDWTISLSPGGWPGLLDTVYTPGSLMGFSVSEKRLKETEWRGRKVWGLSHVRGLDTTNLRLQLDVFFNVVGIVNMVRGLQYYNPDQVILYSHNAMFANPFGQSDARAAIRAADMISNVYKVWYVALKVYGLPYMVGKVSKPELRAAMSAALKSLREGGYVVLPDKDSEIEVLNLAASAAINGFESIVQVQREDIFFAVRLAAQPFMEGKGGTDSHTDTDVQQQTSDAGERRLANALADAINRQLIPWLVGPNFDLPPDRMPRLKLGGTDWKQSKTILDIVKAAKEVGLDVSSEWLHEATSMPAPRNENDVLVSDQEKQAQQQQPGGGNPLAAMLGGGQQPAPEQKPPAQPEPKKPLPIAPPKAADKPEEPPDEAAVEMFTDAVRLLPTSRLSADPARFQFRSGHDGDDGTVRDLPSDTFDPSKAPPLLAWHDPDDDEDYVVDGHHRLAWAERDGVRRVPVRFLNAKSAAVAKEMGRRANLNRPAQAEAKREEATGERLSVTFSADHVSDDAAPTAEQVARAAERFFAELKP